MAFFNAPWTTAQESLGISPTFGFLGPAHTYWIRTPMEVVSEALSPPPAGSEAHKREKLWLQGCFSN